MDMETKLLFPCSPGSFCQVRIEGIYSEQDRVPRGICTAAVLTGFAWYRKEAKYRTAVSSPPLHPLPQKQNSFTGKKTLSDLLVPACLSLRRRNYYIYLSAAGMASQVIPLIHPFADGCSGQYCLSWIPGLSFPFYLSPRVSQLLKDLRCNCTILLMCKALKMLLPHTINNDAYRRSSPREPSNRW